MTTRLMGDDLALPAGFRDWPPLGQAQYLEMTVFLSQYLLSSQGDRVAMAHSVEGRYPFLDYRVVEFCNRLPPGLKLRGLMEKWLLRRVASSHLPAEIWQRPKRPYRAPIHTSFFSESAPDYVADLLSPAALEESGLFDPLRWGNWRERPLPAGRSARLRIWQWPASCPRNWCIIIYQGLRPGAGDGTPRRR